MPHFPAGKEAISDHWGVVKQIVEVDKKERERAKKCKKNGLYLILMIVFPKNANNSIHNCFQFCRGCPVADLFCLLLQPKSETKSSNLKLGHLVLDIFDFSAPKAVLGEDGRRPTR